MPLEKSEQKFWVIAIAGWIIAIAGACLACNPSDPETSTDTIPADTDLPEDNNECHNLSICLAANESWLSSTCLRVCDENLDNESDAHWSCMLDCVDEHHRGIFSCLDMHKCENYGSEYICKIDCKHEADTKCINEQRSLGECVSDFSDCKIRNSCNG